MTAQEGSKERDWLEVASKPFSPHARRQRVAQIGAHPGGMLSVSGRGPIAFNLNYKIVEIHDDGMIDAESLVTGKVRQIDVLQD